MGIEFSSPGFELLLAAELLLNFLGGKDASSGGRRGAA